MNERVIYIEDDPAQARLAQKYLERAGYTVDLAADGDQGLAQCAQQRYDAVIVDQTMPGLSGLDIIRTLRQRGAMPPTIMVTGTGNEHIAVEAMKLGLSDYLVKDLEGGFVNILPLVVQRVIAQQQTLVEKQQMEQELAQAEKLKAIGQLAAGIAHEINTPTQYIGDNARFLENAFEHIAGMLDDLKKLLQATRENAVTDALLDQIEQKLRKADLEYLSSEIPQAIRQSLEGVRHVSEIVGAMKEYSHPDGGRQQPIDLNHAVENAVTLCQNEWKYVANVITDFDAELPLVRCVPSDIHRVVVNLVVNAAHATAEATRFGGLGKRPIIVRTRRDGPSVELRVKDFGCGIADDIRDRVFEPFFTTKDVGVGTGQGLSIARALVVDRHGGTIRFDSELGHGTTFYIRLPIEGMPEPTPQPSVEQEEPELQPI
ncbi:MAG: hybrid sensor histidine kinase/response regulator [Planctomycetaceae bacterium]|nr:hybrid sensor histidine kinase/response regulator [Planctomycetaceae bacterium]